MHVTNVHEIDLVDYGKASQTSGSVLHQLRASHGSTANGNSSASSGGRTRSR